MKEISVEDDFETPELIPKLLMIDLIFFGYWTLSRIVTQKKID